VLLENHFSATLSLPPAISVLTIVDAQPGCDAGRLWAWCIRAGGAERALARGDVGSRRESRDDRCRSAGADARCAVRARDLCREGENRANRCDYSVARRPFPLLDEEETIKQFPRVLWDDELPAVGAKDHFVFRDLIARAGAMAQLERAERIALVDSGRVLEQFPASFEGLREGYEQAATHYERHGALRGRPVKLSRTGGGHDEDRTRVGRSDSRIRRRGDKNFDCGANRAPQSCDGQSARSAELSQMGYEVGVRRR
jgi:hypothetical protein